MKLKRILFAVLAVVMLSATVFSALAEQNAEPGPELPALPTGYLSYTGTVTAVSPYYSTNDKPKDGYHFVLIETEDGAVINFLVTPETCAVTGQLPAEGDLFTGWYDASRPVILIYPPQYSAVAYAVNLEDSVTVKVERFNTELVSDDDELALIIGEDTPVFDHTGAPLEDAELTGRALAVLYTAGTWSIPAHAAPEAVFVLHPSFWEDIVPEDLAFDGDMPIIVKGETIDAPTPYYLDGGTELMVPVRAISEALGFKVTWEQATQSVQLGNVYSLTLGKDAYIVGRRVPMSLGVAPELTEGSTYVPLRYFREVLGMNNAYVFEGSVVIDNEEIMN